MTTTSSGENTAFDHVYAVILAGGSGTRFWPLSRQARPKQFLPILSGRSLLQETVERVMAHLPPERIYVFSHQRYRRLLREQLAVFGIPDANILLEPSAKNTAPSIGWASAHICRKDPDAVTLVLPSDHLIKNETAFRKNLAAGVRLSRRGFLVTMGIVPTRPETGYGYLKARRMRHKGITVWKVDEFTEKPDLRRAKRFMKAKNYFWNSGMFVWRCEDILAAYARYVPDVHAAFAEKTHGAHVRKVWPSLPTISVDYGILEKATNVVTLPAQNIGWSDLGSWESLMEVMPGDRNGNVTSGNVVMLDNKRVFIRGERRMIATIGLSDCIIVDTPEALLICRKDCSQQVKNVVEYLKQNHRSEI